jgi:hypothetical protein
VIDKGKLTTAAVLLLAGGAASGYYLNLATEVRAPLVLLFLAVGPGLALVPLLGITRGLSTATLTIAVSLSLAALTSGILLYSERWDPGLGFGALLAIALGGAALQAARGRVRLVGRSGRDGDEDDARDAPAARRRASLQRHLPASGLFLFASVCLASVVLNVVLGRLDALKALRG